MTIAELLDRKESRPFFSFEFFPPQAEKDFMQFYDEVDQLANLNPLFVSVTYGAGGHKQQNTLNITKELVKRNLETMAHLTCVGATSEKIHDFLNSLQDNEINNVLALRGDPPKDGNWDWKKGEFKSAENLVAYINKNFPAMGIGVAAYPCPHPESLTIAKDREATAQKLRAGGDFAITQLFFDVREYIDLVDRLREMNIQQPIIPGIMTIQSFASLRKVLSMCGAHIPAKLYLELEEADKRAGVEGVRLAGIKFAIWQIEELLKAGAPGIHLYTLNKSNLCKKIVKEFQL